MNTILTLRLMLNLHKAITGFGDYKIHGNSLMSIGGTLPKIYNSSNSDTVIIRHKEYLGDISPSANFVAQVFPLNPGLRTSFPWLSQVAAAFEEYEWRGLLFEYKTLSSDTYLSSSNLGTSLGCVIMATNYNVLNPTFADKRSMENYEFSNDAKPSLSFVHPVECSRSQTPVTHLYIRQDEAFQNLAGDLRLYDLANFTIATAGMPQNSSTIIGELWATYECAFFKPKYSQENNVNTLHTIISFPYAIGSNLYGTNYTFGSWNYPTGTQGPFTSGASVGNAASTGLFGGTGISIADSIGGASRGRVIFGSDYSGMIVRLAYWTYSGGAASWNLYPQMGTSAGIINGTPLIPTVANQIWGASGSNLSYESQYASGQASSGVCTGAGTTFVYVQYMQLPAMSGSDQVYVQLYLSAGSTWLSTGLGILEVTQMPNLVGLPA